MVGEAANRKDICHSEWVSEWKAEVCACEG